MAQKIILKKGVYESAKIAAKKAELISKEDLSTLSSLSYEEILKYLEEHGFKEVIDKSYLSYEGFYLIEKILNDYLSALYTKFLKATSKNNRQFLERYYLKYQIHNLMATIRCMESSQEELEPYLIGDSRRKEKYLKAFDMSKNECLKYLAKKLKLDSQEVLNYYDKGLFELENYLYGQYYSQLLSYLPVYKSNEDKKFSSFVKAYIDLLNGRTFFLLENEPSVSFKELFILGGSISFEDYTSNNQSKLYGLLSQQTSVKIKKPVDIDKAISELKREASSNFTSVSFGSPYEILGFFFTLEQSIGDIRKLLKAKYMKLTQEELNEVLSDE